jgi:hypothetical protein
VPRPSESYQCPIGLQLCLDCLKPERQRVEHRNKSSSDADGIDHSKGYASLFDDARRDGGIFLPPNLDESKSNDKHPCKHKESNDPPVVPRVHGPTPLKHQYEANDA